MDEVIFKFFYPCLIIAGLVYKGLAFFEKNDADEKSTSAFISAITLVIAGILQIALCIYILKNLVKYLLF